MGRQWCHFCGFVYVQLQTRITLRRMSQTERKITRVSLFTASSRFTTIFDSHCKFSNQKLKTFRTHFLLFAIYLKLSQMHK